MKKSIVSAAVAGALAVGSLLAMPPAVGAASQCPSNRVCLFVDRDYIGLLVHRAGGGGLINLSAGANNKMSSWINRTTSTGAWYAATNGAGNCYNLNATTFNSYVGFAFNDQASSWKTNRGC